METLLVTLKKLQKASCILYSVMSIFNIFSFRLISLVFTEHTKNHFAEPKWSVPINIIYFNDSILPSLY